MTQAHEHRIGNLILSNTIIDTVNIDTLDYLLNYTNSDAVQPIPITEEWLLKFGFEVVRPLTFAIKIPKGENKLELIEHPNEYTVIIHGEFGMVRLPMIKYIHDLQNLFFALTHKELELKQ